MYISICHHHYPDTYCNCISFNKNLANLIDSIFFLNSLFMKNQNYHLQPFLLFFGNLNNIFRVNIKGFTKVVYLDINIY